MNGVGYRHPPPNFSPINTPFKNLPARRSDLKENNYLYEYACR